MDESSKRLADMTPAEQAEAVKRAVRRFQRELDETADKIGEALEALDDDTESKP